jgi:hypothetical protein
MFPESPRRSISLVLTLLDRCAEEEEMNLIESCFHISPDSGNGLFEFVLIVALVICTAIALFLSDRCRVFREERALSPGTAIGRP